MFYTGFIFIFIQCLFVLERVHGHGYLADPPARSSAWLFDNDFSKCCKYYNHIEMSCGGTYHQWVVNGGKCTICGEPFDRKIKLLGVGDPMYLGKIVRTYTQGSTIPVTVVLTANHLGTFEFRVCSIDNDTNQDATQTCLDLNLLQVSANGSSEFQVESSFTTVVINVTLPADLVCKHCVFQWKYKTGNSWGSANGKSCLGCGTENEEFYGCADIAVVSSVEGIVDSSSIPSPLTTTTAVVPIKSTTLSPRKCTSAVVFSQVFDLNSIMEQYCQTVCSSNCASDHIDGGEVLYAGCMNSCDKLCACT